MWAIPGADADSVPAQMQPVPAQMWVAHLLEQSAERADALYDLFAARLSFFVRNRRRCGRSTGGLQLFEVMN